jgi:hypothetical protein
MTRSHATLAASQHVPSIPTEPRAAICGCALTPRPGGGWSRVLEHPGVRDFARAGFSYLQSGDVRHTLDRLSLEDKPPHTNFQGSVVAPRYRRTAARLLGSCDLAASLSEDRSGAGRSSCLTGPTSPQSTGHSLLLSSSGVTLRLPRRRGIALRNASVDGEGTALRICSGPSSRRVPSSRRPSPGNARHDRRRYESRSSRLPQFSPRAIVAQRRYLASWQRRIRVPSARLEFSRVHKVSIIGSGHLCSEVVLSRASRVPSCASSPGNPDARHPEVLRRRPGPRSSRSTYPHIGQASGFDIPTTRRIAGVPSRAGARPMSATGCRALESAGNFRLGGGPRVVSHRSSEDRLLIAGHSHTAGYKLIPGSARTKGEPRTGLCIPSCDRQRVRTLRDVSRVASRAVAQMRAPLVTGGGSSSRAKSVSLHVAPR